MAGLLVIHEQPCVCEACERHRGSMWARLDQPEPLHFELAPEPAPHCSALELDSDEDLPA